MKTRKARIILPGLLAILLLAAAGCILSGQFIIVFEADGTITSDDENMDYVIIDLTDDGTWNDHKDDIQNIVDVKCEAKFINNDDAANSGEIWVSDGDNPVYTSVPTMKAHSIRFISGVELDPGASKEVSFSESSSYIDDLQGVLDLVESGKFYVYGVAGVTPFDVTVTGVAGHDHARLMITFSAG